MPKIVKNFSLNARRAEDAEILAKLNAAAPYFYKDVHKTGRLLLTKALDEFIREHNIDWRFNLSALAAR